MWSEEAHLPVSWRSRRCEIAGTVYADFPYHLRWFLTPAWFTDARPEEVKLKIVEKNGRFLCAVESW